MRFSTVSAIFALVASALAQDGSFDPIYTPAAYQEVPVGEPFQITWDATPATAVNAHISIQLIGGPAQALQVPLYTIVTGILNSDRSYTWTPSPSEYGKNFYGLVITNLDTKGQFQYSNPFKVVGPKSTSTTTTAAATSTATATSTAAVTSTATDSTTTKVATTVATTTIRSTAHESQSTESTTTISLTSSAVHVSAEGKPTHTMVEESSSVAVVPAPTFTPIHNINGTGPYQSAYPTTFVSHSATGDYVIPAATVSPVPAIGGAATKGFSLVLVGAGALFALAF